MRSMASQSSVPLGNRKRDAFVRSDILNVSPDAPRKRESASPIREDAIPSSSPSLAHRYTATLSAMDSRSLSLIPYAPLISAELLSAIDAKVTTNGSYNAPMEGELDLEEDKRRDREHKKRSKNWTRQETLVLIRSRTELAPRFAMIGRKSELWDEIAETLRRERFCRDAQQCRDKWEKLMAGYKEVRDGLKEKRDNPFFDELHPLLSGRIPKKEKEKEGSVIQLENGSTKKEKEREGSSMHHVNGPEGAVRHAVQTMDIGGEVNTDSAVKDLEKEAVIKSSPRVGLTEDEEEDDFDGADGVQEDGEEDEEEEEDDEDKAAAAAAMEEEEITEQKTASLLRKRKRGPKFVSVTDLHAVQTLLETILSRQQRFFKDILNAMERREQLREQMRQEREEQWRAEERAQRCIFNNAMLVLTQKLVGERTESVAPALSGSLAGIPVCHQGPKKRSKNWKRAEVLQLIKLRGDMDGKFVKSTRRAALWDELAELLWAQGIKRDGKQCREKWDKLMSEYKDVVDGKRAQGDSPYFVELTAIVGG
eukprot:c28284_g1_i3 orf=732-2342(+)